MMSRFPDEPDDITVWVAGGDSDPASIQETIDWIKANKTRPEYAAEKAELERILKDMGWTKGEDGKWNIPGWTYDSEGRPCYTENADGDSTTA